MGETLPGFSCSNDTQCSTKLCCDNFCSACCHDSDCPDQDICIIQKEFQPLINYRTCFYSNYLPINAPCWQNSMCESNFCEGGILNGWNIEEGKCVQNGTEIGKGSFINYVTRYFFLLSLNLIYIFIKVITNHCKIWKFK